MYDSFLEPLLLSTVLELIDHISTAAPNAIALVANSSHESGGNAFNCVVHQMFRAAKGGSVQVVKYLLAAGASPRSLDENGSLPLYARGVCRIRLAKLTPQCFIQCLALFLSFDRHLSCWAGHADASLVLLRASDVKDLYVQDYDV
jgi:hypothetical protein